jgi:hypothetical protein
LNISANMLNTIDNLIRRRKKNVVGRGKCERMASDRKYRMAFGFKIISEKTIHVRSLLPSWECIPICWASHRCCPKFCCVWWGTPLVFEWLRVLCWGVRLISLLYCCWVCRGEDEPYCVLVVPGTAGGVFACTVAGWRGISVEYVLQVGQLQIISLHNDWVLHLKKVGSTHQQLTTYLWQRCRWKFCCLIKAPNRSINSARALADRQSSRNNIAIDINLDNLQVCCCVISIMSSGRITIERHSGSRSCKLHRSSKERRTKTDKWVWGVSRIWAHFRKRPWDSILQADIRIGPIFDSKRVVIKT